MPPADFLEMLGQIRLLYNKYCAALAAAPAGSDRARAFHRMMDAAVATAANIPVSCRYGCCGCCHCEVEITEDEAAVLREKIHGGVEIDRERLAKQAARPLHSPAWQIPWSRDNRCVFLSEEGVCRIYEDRPAACRRLLVTTPAEACTTPEMAVAPVRILLAEVLVSAAVQINQGVFATLSKMVRAAPL